MKTCRIISLGFSLILLTLSSCSSIFKKDLKCGGTNGECFDVTIDGKRAIHIDDREKLDRYAETTTSSRIRANISYTRWIIKDPISSKPDVKFAANEKTKDWFGIITRASVTVLPIDGQQISSVPAISASNNVTINGKAPLTQKRIINQGSLPPGEYILTVRIEGTNHYESKYIFVTVM